MTLGMIAAGLILASCALCVFMINYKLKTVPPVHIHDEDAYHGV